VGVIDGWGVRMAGADEPIRSSDASTVSLAAVNGGPLIQSVRQQGARWRSRTWAVIAIAFATGCSSTGGRSSVCKAPPIPSVGTVGAVTLLVTHGAGTTFHGRQWYLPNPPASLSGGHGEARVIPATPYPMLKVRTDAGAVVILRILPVGCA
jgi:hypothetical protein